MKRVLASAAAVLLLGTLVGCGGAGAKDAAADGPTGEVHLNLNGGVSVDGTMAVIAIRNVFEPDQVFLVDCKKKDHQLNGEDFCDELVVLPPGVYEVIVQSKDPECKSAEDHYKIIVKANETVEQKIDLVCGPENGGLDVIVKKTEPPVVRDVDFRFLHTWEKANKFICRCRDDVKVTVKVTDSDTDCATLFQHFQWLVNGSAVNINPPIIGQGTSLNQWDGSCQFSALIDSNAPKGDYDLTLAVSDGKHETDFTFPIHLIDCDQDAGTPDAGHIW